MKTDKGKLNYEMSLIQIRNAILETLYYGGIEEYLMCKEYNNTWNARHGKRLAIHTIKEQMRDEVDNWACIQKSEGGWDLLDSRCKRILQDAGHQPNAWILPRGTKPYIALDMNQTAYFLKGPDGQALYNSALNGQNVNQIDMKNNCRIFESKVRVRSGAERFPAPPGARNQLFLYPFEFYVTLFISLLLNTNLYVRVCAAAHRLSKCRRWMSRSTFYGASDPWESIT